MAWRSLRLWFSRFRKSYYPDVIVIYKNYLYDEWFNSLSEEEQKAEVERQQRLKEKRKRDGEEALKALQFMTAKMREISHKNGSMNSYYSDVLDFW